MFSLKTNLEPKLEGASYVLVPSRAEVRGITDEEIKEIVHCFYAKIQKDEVLAAIFESEMTEDWDLHLQKMCNFWSTVMFAKGLYKGNP